MQSTVYILDRFARTNPVYHTWLEDCPFPCEVVTAMPSRWSAPDDAGLIVTHQHYQWETIAALRKILEQGRVPILILSDGVLEFRNTWQNPSIAGGAIFQPLVGHKLACLGRAPARQIEALGNAGKCEIVGHPRFDEMAELPTIPTQDEGPFRLLITTARTPAFTESQKEKVIEGLQQIRNRLTRNPYAQGRLIEVNWRLPDEYAAALNGDPNGSPNGDPDSEHASQSLGEAIELSDAVITTPSTVYLESVIKRRPTAILDFTNSPSYMNAAWTISAAAHVSPVLEELASPPPAKMLFQRNNLHDQLELRAGSKQRLFTLFREMIQAGEHARRNDEPVWLPTRILSDPQRGIARVEHEFDLASLYPADHSPTPKSETLLQQELTMAIARLGQLPEELHQKSNDIECKSSHIEFLTEMLEETQTRLRAENDTLIESLDQQTEALRRKSEHIEQLSQLFEQNNEKLRRANSELAKIKTHLKHQATALQTTIGELFPSEPEQPNVGIHFEETTNTSDANSGEATLNEESEQNASDGPNTPNTQAA